MTPKKVKNVDLQPVDNDADGIPIDERVEDEQVEEAEIEIDRKTAEYLLDQMGIVSNMYFNSKMLDDSITDVSSDPIFYFNKFLKLLHEFGL